MRYEVTHRDGVACPNPRTANSLTTLVVSFREVTVNEARVDLQSRPSLESVRAAMTAALPAGTVIRPVVSTSAGCLELGHPEDVRPQVGWAAVTPDAVTRHLGHSPDALAWAWAWRDAARELAEFTAYARGDDYGFIVVDSHDQVIAQKAGYRFHADAVVAASATMAGLTQNVPAPRPRLAGVPISYSSDRTR